MNVSTKLRHVSFLNIIRPKKMGALTQEELENEIRDCGLFRAKPKTFGNLPYAGAGIQQHRARYH